MSDGAPRSIADRALSLARTAKHQGAVFAKHASWGFPYQRGPLLEPLHKASQARRPHLFQPGMHADAWFTGELPGRDVDGGERVERRVFCVWTGDNEMPDRRRENLAQLVRVQQGIEVVLVSPETLDDWIVPGFPLHPAYPNLSLVHRSDYLRAYLLHHHGGGYADIKRSRSRWSEVFTAFESSDCWLAGYTEAHRLLVPLVGGSLERDLKRASRQLLGYGTLLARPRTALTEGWMSRVHVVLDHQAVALASFPGNVRGDNTGYPLAWTEILANVVAPLTWRYRDNVMHDDRLRPVLKDYT